MGSNKPAIVEPVHPLEGCELDGLEVAPRASSMDDFSLVETVDRFGEGVVVESPTLPTEGSIPASASRSVYLIETYWADSSGRRNTFEGVAMKHSENGVRIGLAGRALLSPGRPPVAGRDERRTVLGGDCGRHDE